MLDGMIECPICYGNDFSYEQDPDSFFDRLVLVCQDCGHSLGDKEDEMEHELYRTNQQIYGWKVRYG